MASAGVIYTGSRKREITLNPIQTCPRLNMSRPMRLGPYNTVLLLFKSCTH